MLDTLGRNCRDVLRRSARRWWAARFVSQLEFGVADRVREAIVEMAPQLERITVERVAVELDKMLLGADPRPASN